MALAAVGFLGLAIDVGAKFSQKRMAQAAADAAALAYAEEISYGASTTQAQNAANAMATLNGFNKSAPPNPATDTPSTPSGGSFTGSAYTQMTVSQPIATGFMAVFS